MKNHMITGSGVKNLYLDIDGVLFCNYCIADNAQEFLELCLKRFNCYWLTFHCTEGTTDHLFQ